MRVKPSKDHYRFFFIVMAYLERIGVTHSLLQRYASSHSIQHFNNCKKMYDFQQQKDNHASYEIEDANIKPVQK